MVDAFGELYPPVVRVTVPNLVWGTALAALVLAGTFPGAVIGLGRQIWAVPKNAVVEVIRWWREGTWQLVGGEDVAED